MNPTAESQLKDRVGRLLELFPEIRTEGNGIIDFDTLQALLGAPVQDETERYGLTWPGKSAAIRQAQTDSKATLRPVKAKSVDWDSTRNLYVEGDSLEVLKLLRRPYYGQVDLVIADAPSSQDLDHTDGMRHSAWASMVYPRLRMARDLLSERGSIFVGADQEDAAMLRKIGDEIFGENRFIGDIAWQDTDTVDDAQTGIGGSVRHFLAWCKNGAWIPNKLARTAQMDEKYKNPDNDTQPWQSDNAFASEAAKHQGMVYAIQHPFTGKMLYPPVTNHWRYQQSQMLEYMNGWCEYRLEDLHDEDRRAEVCGVPAEDVRPGVKAIVLAHSLEESRRQAQRVLERGQWPRFYFTRNGLGGIRRKTYLDSVDGRLPTNFWAAEETGTRREGVQELERLFGRPMPLDGATPVGLVRRMLDIATAPDALVLDMFSGTAVTAQAVMRANLDDDGHRRWILVQAPTKAPEPWHTWCELGQERIRRAADAIATQRGEDGDEIGGNGPGNVAVGRWPDVGFRVFTLDTSNIEIPAFTGVESLRTDTIKEDRSNEDVLFEVMLRWSLDLSSPLTVETFHGYEYVMVSEGEVVYCADAGLSVDVLEHIADADDPPSRVLILDRVFEESDEDPNSLKLNALSIFGRSLQDGGKIELRTV